MVTPYRSRIRAVYASPDKLPVGLGGGQTRRAFPLGKAQRHQKNRRLRESSRKILPGRGPRGGQVHIIVQVEFPLPGCLSLNTIAPCFSSVRDKSTFQPPTDFYSVYPFPLQACGPFFFRRIHSPPPENLVGNRQLRVLLDVPSTVFIPFTYTNGFGGVLKAGWGSCTPRVSGRLALTSCLLIKGRATILFCRCRVFDVFFRLRLVSGPTRRPWSFATGLRRSTCSSADSSGSSLHGSSSITSDPERWLAALLRLAGGIFTFVRLGGLHFGHLKDHSYRIPFLIDPVVFLTELSVSSLRGARLSRLWASWFWEVGDHTILTIRYTLGRWSSDLP